MREYRTNTCGELRKENIGNSVKLAGWVQKIRNLGAMTFIDLRDEFGITQIVIQDNEVLEKVKSDLTTECCIMIEGNVVERASKNDKIPTGDIEYVVAQGLEEISTSEIKKCYFN